MEITALPVNTVHANLAPHGGCQLLADGETEAGASIAPVGGAFRLGIFAEQALAIKAPFKTILENAGLELDRKTPTRKGQGYNVVTGKMVNMIKSGIIDPLLVTKSALQNAASVATTILSTDCVINNLRIDESNR